MSSILSLLLRQREVLEPPALLPMTWPKVLSLGCFWTYNHENQYPSDDGSYQVYNSRAGGNSVVKPRVMVQRKKTTKAAEWKEAGRKDEEATRVRVPGAQCVRLACASGNKILPWLKILFIIYVSLSLITRVTKKFIDQPGRFKNERGHR